MKVELLQCERGHFYTSAQGRCPLCFGGNEPALVPEELDLPVEIPQTIPEMPEFSPNVYRQPSPEVEDVTSTTPWFENQNPVFERTDPVVGWLVCTKGPRKGNCWRLHTGTNFIGRGLDMDVCITGDQMISSSRACAVSYDERSRSFFLEGGDGRNNIYLNDRVLRRAEDLVIYDRISIGNTELILIPFCGEQFSWSEV